MKKVLSVCVRVWGGEQKGVSHATAEQDHKKDQRDGDAQGPQQNRRPNLARTVPRGLCARQPRCGRGDNHRDHSVKKAHVKPLVRVTGAAAHGVA